MGLRPVEWRNPVAEAPEVSFALPPARVAGERGAAAGLVAADGDAEGRRRDPGQGSGRRRRRDGEPEWSPARGGWGDEPPPGRAEDAPYTPGRPGSEAEAPAQRTAERASPVKGRHLDIRGD